MERKHTTVFGLGGQIGRLVGIFFCRKLATCTQLTLSYYFGAVWCFEIPFD